MYENMYPLVQFILDLHTHVCMHAHPRTCTPARKAHPARMLTFLFSQDGKIAHELANDKVKAAFAKHAEHSDITDDSKDALLLLCARLGLASRVRAVLQAGANAAHTDNQVRVRA